MPLTGLLHFYLWIRNYSLYSDFGIKLCRFLSRRAVGFPNNHVDQFKQLF